MKRKLVSIFMVLLLCIGYLFHPVIPQVYAHESDEQIYQLTKAMSEEDLTNYGYNIDNVNRVEVYVSSLGNDDSGDGSQEQPFATLSKAVDVVEDGGTVYVLDDLVIDESVRVINKSVVIDGLGNTVKRGTMKQVQDNARSTYNPAMFEINNWSNDTNHHALTFKNIIIDEDGKVAGAVYQQQSTDGSFGNENKVQDAMIACYTSNDIVLKEGAVIRNYAGMSAVRLTSSAKLIMEKGSVIEDSKTIERGNGTSDATGQVGAVWLQGGQLEMQSGSTIQNMVGRAIYLDGGTVNVGGTIANIDGRAKMMKGCQGVAIHIRNDGKAILSGQITKIKANVAGSDNVVAIRNNGCNFESTAESKIEYVENMPVLFAYYSKDVIGGMVENCSFDYLFRATYNDMIFSETALIQNNTCKSGAAKAVVYSTNGAKYTFNGQMINNDATYAFYIINHGDSAAQLIMNNGAKLSGPGKNTGVYINASGCTFTMNGGEITNFNNGINCRGKNNSSATFIMNGGHIHGNKSYGVYANGMSNSKSLVQLNAGTIENNGDEEIYMSGGNATSAYDHLELKAGILNGNGTVKLSPGTITLDKNYQDIQLGITKKEAVNKMKELVANDKNYADWSVVGSNAYWIKPSTTELSFKVNSPSSAKKTGLFVTYIELNDDGTPVGEAKLLAMDEVDKGNYQITMHDLKPNTAYAVMLVNNTTYTLNPDRVVKYIGGGQGQETSTTGFPYFTVTDSLDKIKSLEINGKDTGLKGQEALDKLYELLDITVTDENGKVIKNDLIPGDYISRFSFKDSVNKVRINGNEVVPGDQGGYLIIRGVSDKAGAISGEITYPLLTDEPQEKLDHAVAIAKKSFLEPSFYINNDKDRKVANTKGISILDDDLLVLDENDNRQELLENKAKEFLGISDKLGQITHFDFHYLDLVDAFDGNVWVSCSNGTTVYLPYPDGTDKTTDLQLVHFKGLHREHNLKNQDDVIEAVKNSELEAMKIEKTEVGIKFDVGASGFSPFAIVWTDNVGTAKVTVNYIDQETGKSLLAPYEEELTVNSQYDVSDHVNIEVPGYHIESITGSINGVMSKDGVIVTVNYLNEAPTINAEDVVLTVGDEFNPLENITATDFEDGDIPLTNDHIIKNDVDTTKAGVYEVIYQVTDSQGASTTKTIYVTVNPKMEALNHVPTISASDKTLTVGDKFDPLKDVTASDKEDGSNVKLEVLKNTVDSSKAGVYEVVYKATDSKGASATKTIKVTVKTKNIVAPNTNANTDSSNNPETGDKTNLGLFASLLTISALALAGIVVFKKKKTIEK